MLDKDLIKNRDKYDLLEKQELASKMFTHFSNLNDVRPSVLRRIAHAMQRIFDEPSVKCAIKDWTFHKDDKRLLIMLGRNRKKKDRY